MFLSLLLLVTTFFGLKVWDRLADQNDFAGLYSGNEYGHWSGNDGCGKVAAIVRQCGDEVLPRRGNRMHSLLLMIVLLFLAMSGLWNNKPWVDYLLEAVLRRHPENFRCCITQRGPPVCPYN